MPCSSNTIITCLFSIHWAETVTERISDLMFPIFWGCIPWNTTDSGWCHVLTLTLCQKMLHVQPSRRVQINLCSFRLGVSRWQVSTHVASTLNLILLPQISVERTSPTSSSSLPKGPQKMLSDLLTLHYTVSLPRVSSVKSQEAPSSQTCPIFKKLWF